MTQQYKHAVFDSLIWIGAKWEEDQYKKHAMKIIESFLQEDIKKIFITDYILVETINFLLRKAGFRFAHDVSNSIINSARIEIVYVDELMLDDIKKLFVKYKDLSITDCSIIALMLEKGIQYLFSFDAGFDKVKEIIRLEYI